MWKLHLLVVEPNRSEIPDVSQSELRLQNRDVLIEPWRVTTEKWQQTCMHGWASHDIMWVFHPLMCRNNLSLMPTLINWSIWNKAPYAGFYLSCLIYISSTWLWRKSVCRQLVVQTNLHIFYQLTIIMLPGGKKSSLKLLSFSPMWGLTKVGQRRLKLLYDSYMSSNSRRYFRLLQIIKVYQMITYVYFCSILLAYTTEETEDLLPTPQVHSPDVTCVTCVIWWILRPDPNFCNISCGSTHCSAGGGADSLCQVSST